MEVIGARGFNLSPRTSAASGHPPPTLPMRYVYPRDPGTSEKQALSGT